ncbi:hypothetical protein [Massilia sp. TWR1-2-2]|uniref:hypothetical protein n=1 Tax=Massilia sp. TWR1-2-2 TaxID=2804584 RepID=UPI003CEB451A
MELFFMMTAMLALLGPIALGRVRCIRVTPRLRGLACYIFPVRSRVQSGTFNFADMALDARKYSAKLNWTALFAHAIHAPAFGSAGRASPHLAPGLTTA